MRKPKPDVTTIRLDFDTRKLGRELAAIATSFASTIDAALDRAAGLGGKKPSRGWPEIETKTRATKLRKRG